MSDPVIKGAKRPTTRPATRSAATASPAKGRKPDAKSARPKPLAKRAGAEKAPARKAAATKASAPASKAPSKPTKAKAKPKPTTLAKPTKKTAPAKRRAPAKPAAPAKSAAKATKQKPATATRAAKRPTQPPRQLTAPRPQPSQAEAAALRAFERAHKEFARGRFADARQLFRALIEQYPTASEVTARARIYLNVAESRLRAEAALPRDADALYDRGVIELNRGDYVAAQELFERALKREPEAAHIHYGLAATRARLGSVTPALESLERALTLQPNLRIRAQHDLDLVLLRNEPDYERLIFAGRS